MPFILGVVGRLVLDFAKTDEFARLQQIRKDKVRYQKALITEKILSAKERAGLQELLEEEAKIFKTFSDKYVPNAQRALALLKRTSKRKALDKEVKDALKSFISVVSLFIDYNKRRFFGRKDSQFATAVTQQLEAVKSARYHQFMGQLDLQKDLEMDLYNRLKRVKLEGRRLSKFKKYFDPAQGYVDYNKVWAELDIPLRGRMHNPGNLAIVRTALAGVLVITMLVGALIGNNIFEKGIKIAGNYVIRAVNSETAEELKKLIAILKSAGIDAKPVFADGAAYVVVHVKMVHDVSYRFKHLKHYDKFETMKEDFLKVGKLQVQIRKVLERLASMGYTDVHTEATMEDESVAKCMRAKGALVKGMGELKGASNKILISYVLYRKHYNLLKEQYAKYKQGKESKETVQNQYKFVKDIKNDICKMISAMMETSITEESTEAEIQAEMKKINSQMKEIESMLANHREELEHYIGGGFYLGASGAIKIRKTENREAHAARMRSTDPNEKSALDDKREQFSMENMIAFMKSSGKNVSIIVFGGAHEWEDNVKRWNASHPFSRIALVEVEVSGFKAAMKEREEMMKDLMKGFEELRNNIKNIKIEIPEIPSFEIEKSSRKQKKAQKKYVAVQKAKAKSYQQRRVR